ncbi:ATP-dependent Clp protease adapter protein CLPS1, chloroplastic-like [Canna indica]|uniref:ATP-dependent Clp protease adapter protein CLPS1, chloroplastic-like n=1 Tax=Canna indica TaxID=4628 RepID=A0AAQ3JS18_9LILI|nr:ATP-dependent Clp protease adapter protein CLPS1, chloroplastic-like [Canna indica]
MAKSSFTLSSHNAAGLSSSSLEPLRLLLVFLPRSIFRLFLMAICGRGAACPALNFSELAPSPTPRLPLSTVAVPSRRSKARAFLAAAAAASRGGSGVLERPTFDQSQFDRLPQAQEGGDIGRLAERRRVGSGDSYKVLLVDDPRHTEKLVESVLPQVVPSITSDGARKLFHESREVGIAVVIVTVKEHAEFYAQMMVRRGLRSAIEPDSNLEG